MNKYTIHAVTVFTLFSLVSLGTASAAPDKMPEQISSCAAKDVGKKMWNGYGLPNGTLGCAAALSNVLKQSGVTCGHSATVTVLRNQLLKCSARPKEIILRNNEGSEIDDAKLGSTGRPGDVLIALMKPPPNLNGGGNAHCGILGDNGNIYTNDWNDGIWKKVNIHLMFDYYPYIRLIRFSNNPDASKLVVSKAD